MASPKFSQGIIYVATGPDYLELACDSAESVIETNPDIEIDLFSDITSFEKSSLFTKIYKLDNPHPRSKIDCKTKSRFDRTLYLDCDTRVVAPLGNLFDLLERFDLAMAHDVRRKSEMIQQGWKEKTPYAFPQLNAGVVLYRKSKESVDFFTQWKKEFQLSKAERDQITLKDLLWRSNIRFYVLPTEYNLRRVTLLDAWEPLDLIPTIIHSHIFLQHLRVPNAKKITDIQELIEIERQALIDEWQALGISDHNKKWF